MSFGVYLFLFLLSAMAVKQIATIAMYGSVFAWLRQSIQTAMNNDSWAGEKLNELFTCKLCMCTQSAIWFIALPTMIIVQNVVHPFSTLIVNISWPLEAFLFTLSWFLLSMAISAASLGVWGLFEYLPEKAEQDSEFREEMLRRQTEQFRGLRELVKRQIAEALPESD